jgi:hypothetical protein
LEEELAAIADGVMLARHVIDLPPHALHEVGGDGKLFCRRQMTHISGMDHEVRLQCGHPVDRLRQCVLGGRMRTGLESDVRVADLAEGELAPLSGPRLAIHAQEAGYPAREGPHHAGTSPQQVLQGSAASHVFRFDDFTHAVALST